jgi:galactose mutarotase-like enzyme
MVEHSSFKGEKALIIDNDVMKLVILPERGSKIVSIIYKPLQYELLYQSEESSYRRKNYGDPFESQDSSGFDEMFPSISTCLYEHFPWKGTEIPDHGEVWSIPWEYLVNGESLRLWVYGVRFPYKLEKTVKLSANSVEIEYRLSNRSVFDFHCLWAAHPLFRIEKGMEIIVPAGMERIINSVSGNRLPNYGRSYDYPIICSDEGDRFDLRKILEHDDAGYQKYYFAKRVSEGWFILYHHRKKLWIKLSFSPDQVPYLGIWLNEGGWEGQHNIAPEPATGAMDRPDVADRWGMGSVLKGKEQKEWNLRIEIQDRKELPVLTNMY